jgi:broad specificity phosphatase PhoE
MRIIAILLLVVVSSCSRKVYVVRHAEKLAPSETEAAIDPANPPLSPAGAQRALVLKRKLAKKDIRNIYATKYTRTLSTAQPLADELGLEIKNYSPDATGHSDLIEEVWSLTDGNVLIVGHSNTIDDLINEFTESREMSDLADKEYNNLFILSRGKDKKMKLKRKRYGAGNP